MHSICRFFEAMFFGGAYTNILKLIGIIAIAVILAVLMYFVIRHPHIKLNSVDFQIVLLGLIACVFIYVLFFSKFSIEINMPILLLLIAMMLTTLHKIKNMLD